MSKSKPKLLIIDGNAIIHRSFHALPPTLRTKDGLLVNAVYGFSSFLLKALLEFKPDYVILTLDKAGPTFRHEAYTEYKATRVKAPDELYEQIPLIKRWEIFLIFPIFEKSGFEADDLIGSLSLQAKKQKNLETIIITGDLDTLQLVDNTTKVYTMSRGLSDSILYDENKVLERYQLSPNQIVDYKALAGDPSDNIPGAKGIGRKTATDLLIEFKNIAGVYQAVSKNNPKIKLRTLELLAESKENVFLSKNLATINRQAPIELSLDQAKFNYFDINNVLKLFNYLEFRSLLKKVSALQTGLQKNKTNSQQQNNEKIKQKKEKTNYYFINTEQDFLQFIKKLNHQKKFAFYLETQEINHNSELIGLSFSWKKSESYFVVINKSRLQQIKPILENIKIQKIGHNLKNNWHILRQNKITLQGLYFDVMVAAYLLFPGERRYELSSLAFLELGIDKLNRNELTAEPQQLGFNFEKPNPEQLSLLANENVDIIWQLQAVLEKKLENNQLLKVFKEIEMPLISVLADMEANGISLNKNYLKNLSQQVEKKIKTLEENIHKLAQAKFNVNSPKQLKEILFEKLNIPTEGIKKTKTGFSTAEEELIKLQPLHPIISFIQEHRELAKLDSTYLKSLPKLINSQTQKIHTTFNQTITATGRLSSQEPNLQNIPTKTEEGRKVREAFTASPGFVLLGFDYSQIELRLAAHISQDKKMTTAFKNNLDIHSATAAYLNNTSLAEITKNMRREAKAVNFGILYGQGPHGLSQSAGISYFEAKEFIKKYFNTYPGIKKMVDNFIVNAQKNGFALTMFGRKRPLPDINSTMPMVRKAAERMAINTPVQGGAADLIKLAMIKIFETIKNDKTNIRLLLQVHDELIFEVKPDKIKSYAVKIKTIMQEVTPLSVPIIVDESQGDTWEDLK